jgi:uncharacterized coiled-coil protein SlyX
MTPEQAAIGEYVRTIAELSQRLSEMASALAQMQHDNILLETKIKSLEQK